MAVELPIWPVLMVEEKLASEAKFVCLPWRRGAMYVF